MSNLADTLVTAFVLRDDYSSGVNRASRATQSFAAHAKAAQGAVGGKGGGGIAGAFSSMKAGVSEATVAIAAVAAAIAGVTAAGAGLVDFGTKALDAFASYDSIQRVFQGIYGNAKDARQMMGYLNAEAQRGQFTFHDLADSAKLVVMNGLKFSDYQAGIEGLATRLGGGGEGLKEATTVLARLSGGSFGEAFEVLRRAGLSPAVLKAMGATFDKSGMFTGNISTALSLFRQIGEKSKGVMAAMEGSPAAALSNVKEAFTRVLAGAGEGIWSEVKGGIAGLADALNNAVDSGAIKNAFSTIVNLFTGDEGPLDMTKGIASVLAGIQTAALFAKNVWEFIKDVLNSPIVKALGRLFLGAGAGVGIKAAWDGMDLGKAYDRYYAQATATLERGKAKKRDPREPDNPNASPLAAIAANTAATAQHTKEAKEHWARNVFGGGDFGRWGVTALELHRQRPSSDEVRVNVVGVRSIEDVIRVAVHAGLAHGRRVGAH